MAWMMDTLSTLGDGEAMAAVTGKPVGLGGSLGRGRATGNGIAIVALALLREHGRLPEETRVAVQGFGKVGAAAARALANAGCQVVAVSDISVGLYDPNGLDVAALEDHVRHASDGLLTATRPLTRSGSTTRRSWRWMSICWCPPRWKRRSPRRTPTACGRGPSSRGPMPR